MILWLAGILCFVLLVRDNTSNMPMYWDYASWQFEMMIISFMAVFSNGSQRDKSALTVVAMYYAWVAATDQFLNDLPQWVLEYETTAFVVLLAWTIARPYTTPSQKRDKSVVSLAFYHGDNAPLLSSLSAIIGMPFSSVSVLADDVVLRPHKSGRLVLRDASVIEASKNYTIINTNTEITDELRSKIKALVGMKTKVGFFRVGCVRSVLPILERCGLEPTNILQYIPSLFYYKVTKAVT